MGGTLISDRVARVSLSCVYIYVKLGVLGELAYRKRERQNAKHVSLHSHRFPGSTGLWLRDASRPPGTQVENMPGRPQKQRKIHGGFGRTFSKKRIAETEGFCCVCFFPLSLASPDPLDPALSRSELNGRAVRRAGDCCRCGVITPVEWERAAAVSASLLVSLWPKLIWGAYSSWLPEAVAAPSSRTKSAR